MRTSIARVLTTSTRIVPATTAAVVRAAAVRTLASASSVLSKQNANQPRILLTGSNGQIGSELVAEMRKRYGNDNVVASDLRYPTTPMTGPFRYIDVTNKADITRAVVEHNITWVVHLASLLSAVGERNPQLALNVNTRGIENVLEVARDYNLRVFAPSTIAVFGPTTPQDNTPDLTIMRPTTMYGVTKVYLELLGEYYVKKYNVDFRSVRYPGIISNVGMPGGGTTDYAVEIYHEAVKNGKYKCFLKEHTKMPMMYMPDAINGTLQLLSAPQSQLKQRTYNLTAMAFTPSELASSISKYMPEFTITYEPDFRQAIADSWPHSLDDTPARQDWGYAPKFDVDAMSKDMLTVLKKKYGK